MASSKKRPLLLFRNSIQISLSFFLLYLGYRFFLFVNFMRSGGEGTFVPRPPAVEAFLPINALMSLRYWLATGIFDPLHPAALTLFLAIIIISVLFKKSFCSWICPIGTISEGLDRFGQKLLGQRYYPPIWLDRTLMGFKYLLLFLFVYVIFFSMGIADLEGFQRTPYSLIADVMMLEFFLDMSNTALAFLIFLALMSVIVPHFWCRYLCPYGALLGLVSIISPWKISRDQEQCTNCGKCNNACPARLKISTVNRVYSPECSGCLNCVEVCPRSGTLETAFPAGKLRLNRWLAGILVVATFFLVIGLAQATAHWHTIISLEDYQRLIPQSSFFSHPTF